MIIQAKLLHALRLLRYRAWRFSDFGSKSAIDSGVEILNGRGVSIGNNVFISRTCRILCISEYQGEHVKSTISIRDGVYLGPNSVICSWGGVSIGKNVLCGDNVYIATSMHGYRQVEIPPALQPLTPPGNLTIGENVWIGRLVTIIGHLSIGRGAVIGANSVVNKDVEPFTVVAGSPAKVIRKYDFGSRQWCAP